MNMQNRRDASQQDRQQVYFTYSFLCNHRGIQQPVRVLVICMSDGYKFLKPFFCHLYSVFVNFLDELR